MGGGLYLPPMGTYLLVFIYISIRDIGRHKVRIGLNDFLRLL